MLHQRNQASITGRSSQIHPNRRSARPMEPNYDTSPSPATWQRQEQRPLKGGPGSVDYSTGEQITLFSF